MSHKPTISIIILNYNGKQFVDDCLSSVLNQTYNNYEVIFVDNNSTDGSADYAKSKYPAIKLIRNKGNYGYAKGNNIGIKQSKGEYVLVLNPDTMVEKTWLAELTKAAKSNDAAAYQPKILNFTHRDLIDTAHPRIHYTGLAWGDIYKKDAGFSTPTEISFGSGTAVMIKRSVLEEIGMLDEDLFMYHEDVDLGWRMLMAGYKILFIPTAVMYHKYAFSRNKKKNYFLERNRFIVLLKNYQRKTLFLILPALVLVELGTLAYAIRERWFLNKIRGYKDVIRNLDRILQKRQKIQHMRKVNDREVTQHFTATIDAEVIRNPVIRNFFNPLLSVYWKIIKRYV